MNVIVRNIPNCITCINILCGCIAIALATQGNTSLGSLTAMQWAYIAIGAAAIADFCDGLAARTLHAYSDMGKELDSLCDLVSFGVAPAAMLWQCLLSSPVTTPIAWIALAIPVCGALRLARFNIDQRQTTSFIGLPIPANAIFWIGFTSIFTPDAGMIGTAPIIAIVLIESYSMISPFKMFSLKFKNLGWRDNKVRWILLVIAIISITCMGLGGLMWLIVAYFLLSRIPGTVR